MAETDSQVQQLLEEGFELLGRRQFRRAAEVGERLCSMHHSAGFEILAQAYAAVGQTERSIEILQEGVQVAPDIWLLWQSLANLLADRQRFEEAHQAYKHALTCAHADPDSIHYNRALAYARSKDFEQAIRSLEMVKGPHLVFKAQSVRVAALNDLQRFDEAMALARQLVEQQAALASPPPEFNEDMARTQAQLGRAAWLKSRDDQIARQQAMTALALYRGEPTALWLLREMDGERDVDRKYFKVRLSDGRVYEVVAAHEAHALALVEWVEGQPVAVAETNSLDFQPQGPTGVYRVS